MATGPAVDPSAAPDQVDAALTWEAPPECPTREQVVAALDSLLTGSAADRRDVVADARVRASETGYVLELRIRSPSGERTRELSATSCAELGEIAALLVAIAIDPAAASREPTAPSDDPTSPNEPHPTSTETPTTPPSPPSPGSDLTPPAAGPPPARPRRELGFSLVAGVGLSIGALPSPTAAVSLGAALRVRALRAELTAVHRVVRPARVPGTDVGADLWSTVGAVELCGVPSLPRVEFPLCAGVEAGTLAGRGNDVSVPRTGRSAWFAVRVGAGITAFPWRRVGFGVSARALLPIVRPTFRIDGVGDVHTVGPAAGDVTGFVEVRFP